MIGLYSYYSENVKSGISRPYGWTVLVLALPAQMIGFAALNPSYARPI